MVANITRKPDAAAMANTVSGVKPARERRGQGRPVSGQNDVGRERLLAATEKLLRAMPPARVTVSRIAREAEADPALIRYYFGSRAALLVEVVDRVTGHPQRKVEPDREPIVALADHIGQTVQLVRRAPYLHRLIQDELEQGGTDESRARVRSMHADLVDFYRTILKSDNDGKLIDADPLFLHLVVLGSSDFFSSAEPLFAALLPEGTDQEKLTADFQAFLTKLILDGLRIRAPAACGTARASRDADAG